MRILCLFGRHAYGDPVRGEGYEYVNFMPALEALASEIELFDTFDRRAYHDFADLNAQLIQKVITFKPDLIFAVLMHYEVWIETLDLIRAHTRAAILHWGTDDSWKYDQFSRFMARHVDLHATTYETVARRAREDGLENVILSQWAANGDFLHPPLPSENCTYDVSFVGAAYGDRKSWIDGLAQRGIKAHCFGHGWDSGTVSAERLREIYRASRISLNFADSGRQVRGGSLQRSRQIKARTFEVPAAGGLLLTQGARGLETHFELGKEICVFETMDELEGSIRALLSAPARRDAVAACGFARVRREHTYAARFPPLFVEALARASRRPSAPSALTPDAIAPFVRKHETGAGLRMLAAASRALSSTFVGAVRGPRAARRAFFEIAWRAVGERVYRATGWPGRLFYAES